MITTCASHACMPDMHCTTPAGSCQPCASCSCMRTSSRFRLHRVDLEVQLEPGAAPAVIQGPRNGNGGLACTRAHGAGIEQAAQGVTRKRAEVRSAGARGARCLAHAPHAGPRSYSGMWITCSSRRTRAQWGPSTQSMRVHRARHCRERATTRWRMARVMHAAAARRWRAWCAPRRRDHARVGRHARARERAACSDPTRGAACRTRAAGRRRRPNASAARAMTGARAPVCRAAPPASGLAAMARGTQRWRACTPRQWGSRAWKGRR